MRPCMQNLWLDQRYINMIIFYCFYLFFHVLSIQREIKTYHDDMEMFQGWEKRRGKGNIMSVSLERIKNDRRSSSWIADQTSNEVTSHNHLSLWLNYIYINRHETINCCLCETSYTSYYWIDVTVILLFPVSSLREWNQESWIWLQF